MNIFAAGDWAAAGRVIFIRQDESSALSDTLISHRPLKAVEPNIKVVDIVIDQMSFIELGTSGFGPSK